MIIDELKKKEKKSLIKKVVIVGILLALLTVFCIYDGFLKQFNPKDFWSYSDELIDGKDDMEGEFVELNVDYLLDYYIQEYTYKDNNITKKEVKTQYYLFPVDDKLSYYVTLIAPKDYFEDFDKICDETWNYIAGSNQPTTNKKVKGVFVELEDEDIKYAAEFFSEAFETTYTEEQVLQLVSPIAIKIDFINPTTNVSFLTFIYIVYAILIAILLYAIIVYVSHRYSSNIVKLVAGDESKLAKMSADYESAMQFPNNFRVGQEYIFGVKGSKYMAIPYEEVVWVYGYIHRNRYGRTGYIKVVNDKRQVLLLSVLNHSVLQEIVQAVYNVAPYLYVGATKENNDLFKKKNFETMVNNVRSARTQYNQNMDFGYNNNQFDNIDAQMPNDNINSNFAE